jgi:hypothetical protein
MTTRPIRGPETENEGDETLRAWAIEQAVQFTKNRDADFGAPTRLAAVFVRYVTEGEVRR